MLCDIAMGILIEIETSLEGSTWHFKVMATEGPRLSFCTSPYYVSHQLLFWSVTA